MGETEGESQRGHHHHDWAGHRRRGPGRHRRGGRRGRNRVSRGETREALLRLLAEEPMHGYQAMRELEERSGGAWQPSPGSIYPTLQQLADEDLVAARAEGGKNIFTLTDAGRQAVDAIEAPPAWERFGGDGAADVAGLRRAMMQLGGAARQVGAAGSVAQIDQARRLIDEARRALYRLLASDDPTDDADTPADADAPSDATDASDDA